MSCILNLRKYAETDGCDYDITIYIKDANGLPILGSMENVKIIFYSNNDKIFAKYSLLPETGYKQLAANYSNSTVVTKLENTDILKAAKGLIYMETVLVVADGTRVDGDFKNSEKSVVFNLI